MKSRAKARFGKLGQRLAEGGSLGFAVVAEQTQGPEKNAQK